VPEDLSFVCPPLMRFVRGVFRPSSDIPAVRPLPDDIAVAVRPLAAKRWTCSALVVSHHLDGLLRTTVSGLLHPDTRWSSLRFWMAPPKVCRPKPTPNGEQTPFPATRFTPLEEFPSPVAVPHHCGRCPLAVLSHCCRFGRRSVRLDLSCVPTATATSASLRAEAIRAQVLRRPCVLTLTDLAPPPR